MNVADCRHPGLSVAADTSDGDNDYHHSCFDLGIMYMFHHKRYQQASESEVKYDPKFAERCLKKGCHAGNPTACHTLAVLYKQGDPQSLKKNPQGKRAVPVIPPNPALGKKYEAMTETLVKQHGVKLK